MKSRLTHLTIALFFTCLLAVSTSEASADDQTDRQPAFKITLDPGHPWRPPFGLERIGRAVQVVVEARDRPEAANYFVTSFLKGKQGPSYPVCFSAESPWFARVTLEHDADELALERDRKPPEKPVELARQVIRASGIRRGSNRSARPDREPR